MDDSFSRNSGFMRLSAIRNETIFPRTIGSSCIHLIDLPNFFKKNHLITLPFADEEAKA